VAGKDHVGPKSFVLANTGLPDFNSNDFAGIHNCD
jgi:hypothetical protein